MVQMPSRLLNDLADNIGIDYIGLAENLVNWVTDIGEKLDRLDASLARLSDAVVEPPRYDDAQFEALIRKVTVNTAGTPVQGPNIAIPAGFTTVIRQRRHAGSTVNGYIALGEHDVTSSDLRSELRDNDNLSLKVSNWSKIWFDADTNTTAFELIAEQ